VLLAFFPLAFTKALIEDKFFSNRASVLIDPEGIVRWAFSEETPGTRRENQALLDQLEAHRRSA
jgi:peroxiredoxin